ncbi:LDH2 family malate/lactate/ureidoglycolate dehydrogenase [Variovorax beijingensis]|uniref:L-lactate dehydrogenase n=2 Tax=Variovorax TaxID=34072 RepID=A0AAE3XY25_VARPD|nr:MULTISPECIES: Ldh family oxidoreductase [Variovorax]MDP9964793.1 L-lactate dehydrogenase [Variovorax paradoxus]MDR6427693.1 L-lactate dehydrogenase [Variovorax paradoxus]MDR6454855.1 L-lactate dehydrogenase [Variovorax paradoxus]TWD76422.1 LDH2 family malate/lactate/ureidoglycolate dehydrogenase [Variovorax beijingensis]
MAVESTQLACFATQLFMAAGMEEDKAACVARLLVLTDCMGRRTHGLAMAPLYLADIAKGGMALSGAPEVVKDTGATVVWDGNYLPGLWLMDRAIAMAMERAADLGVVTVAIRRSHHIGCLAALVKTAADQGFVAIVQNSEPAARRVAPYGGVEPLFTPNPMAIGYPAGEHPVLVDMCASITTTSMTRQKHAAGEQFEHPWLLDGHGNPTRDPAVLEHAEPRGSLQLVGGSEYGHKGFGLALMIEALSQGLSGHGRADRPGRWGGNVFLQILAPDFFAGAEAFSRQTGFFADACRANRPARAGQPVRLPGDQAALAIERAQVHGLDYDAATWAALRGCAERLDVAMPTSDAMAA